MKRKVYIRICLEHGANHGVPTRYLESSLLRSCSSSDEEKVVSDLVRSPSATQLIRYWDYPCEEHFIHTKDGYVLGFQRIPGKRGESTAHTEPLPYKKKPLLLWHGLSICSEVFVCNVKPELNLAFVLADAGYDVWLANTRGNKYSQKHVTLDTKKHHKEFWSFGLDELAAYDLPSAVDYILDATGHQSLSYIGFSQGTAQCFAALAMNDELNHKINLFIALAPAMKPISVIANPAISTLILKYSPQILYSILGRGSFLKVTNTVQKYVHSAILARCIQNAMTFLFGWKLDKFGSVTQQQALYAHLFSDTSVKTIVHWFQIINDGWFKAYDHRDDAAHRSIIPFPTQIQSTIPPIRYPTKHISSKMHLFCGSLDTISDQEFLREHLPNDCDMITVDDYEHMDFLWAIDAKQKVWDRIIELLP